MLLLATQSFVVKQLRQAAAGTRVWSREAMVGSNFGTFTHRAGLPTYTKIVCSLGKPEDGDRGG